MIGVVVSGSLNELEAHIMTTTDLVPVFTGIIQNQSVQLCNARDLHKFLESRQDFSNWIKNRIEQYGFIVDEDYSINLSNRSDGRAGKRRTEYHLTLDMAKELAMVENNEKGRQIRRYFISLERSVKPALPDQSSQAEQLAKQIEKRLVESFAIQAVKPPIWTKPDQAGTKDAVRNLQTTKQIIRDLQIWANDLPAEIGHPLWDALDDLDKLMATCWTEIDEALLHMSISQRFLKRWLGRGR